MRSLQWPTRARAAGAEAGTDAGPQDASASSSRTSSPTSSPTGPILAAGSDEHLSMAPVSATVLVDPPTGPSHAQRPADEVWTPPSWEEIVRDNSARVYRLAYRLTGNQHDAEDLTQEVFVRVFRSLSTYTPGTFEGWLHRITTNLFLDQVRRKQRIRFDALPDDSAERLPGRDPGPERVFEHLHLDLDVQAALDTLPPQFRAAVVLCDIEGLSYEEIAVALDIKLGTVRSRIHRARAQLRDELAHRAPGADPDAAVPVRTAAPRRRRLATPRIPRLAGGPA